MEANNTKAMREAAEAALKTIRGVINGTIAPRSNTVFDCRDKLSAALAKPPRNCDVFRNKDDANYAWVCGYNKPYGIPFFEWLFIEIEGEWLRCLQEQRTQNAREIVGYALANANKKKEGGNDGSK